MRVSDDIIRDIENRNDIVDVLSEYLTFKKSGDNYFALCPFHSEKSGSFVASRSKQIFKCFGCGESGNVISFIMKYRGLDFLQSLNFLAQRVGIALDFDSKKINLDKYYRILKDAARYFYLNLKKNNNIKQYLINRGLSESTIIKFGLGYALNDFKALSMYLEHKGHRISDLLELGLVNEKNKIVYDRFINRVIFPIFDVNGNVIGFGGRILENRLPKYLNSKDSCVFKKGSNLYGLNFLVKDSISYDFIIIVEGYLDCISLHNSGIKNVVASLGTALTIDQIKLISKYTNKIYLCFDIDEAGKKATVRSFDLFKEFISDSIIEVYVIELYGVKDPDEFLNRNSIDDFWNCINNSKTLVEYILLYHMKNLDLSKNIDKKKYLHIVKNIIGQLSIVDRDYYIKFISEHLSIREELIKDYLGNNFSKFKLEGYDIENNCIETAIIKAERQLLNLMLNKEYLTYILNNNVDENLFCIEEHKEAFKLICNFNGNGFDIVDYLKTKLNTYEGIKLLIYFKENIGNYDNNNIISQIDDFIRVLRNNIVADFKSKIAHLIKEYESTCDEDKFIEYLSILNMVSKLERDGKLSDIIDFISNFKV
ncbi:DNA primase [Candidatus Arthromitus sp. SFB-mouse-Japan]|uniref:DNA primase n=1 Tax=Candidatus Arthromitus sp. SFB-mouse TaxID=49118 RepID=UPI00021B7F4D|nr:DNA primase [Candidatus Arthromitus sp. SFB-mouse]EGX29011.1 DNA primase [Candidatus Arthromitus sp. SFB-mouse-NYU]BAK56313.1 DNA primase [Candidatus Arthromitus sp. SFB-mouse-Japan]BAK79642.1 DNA primase [Candidatus Arthromitus sp. SFB-mouse-Yit]